MWKKLFLVIGVIGILFSFNPTTFASATKENVPVLGVSREQWQHDLAEFKSYRFADDFLDRIKFEQDYLKSRRGSEHFELLNGKKPTAKELSRKNPLLQMKQKKSKAKFLTNLELERSDYNKLVNYIPKLKEYYSDNHIAQILPYIALCLNYYVEDSEITFYVNQAVKKETPVEVFKQRLYMVVENETT